jgi:KDO2-lipid IV(A) lauroyltransferase
LRRSSFQCCGEGELSFRHHAESALVRSTVAAFSGLSARRRVALGELVGRTFYRLAGSRRRIALANLRGAFPEESDAAIAALARRSAENFGRVLLDFLAASDLPAAELSNLVRMDGATHYLAALKRGKGVFLLSAHFGNWEIGALAAGLLGGPISSVVRPLDNPLLETELARRRGRFGNRIIAKKNAAREILRELRAGKGVAILIDQNVLAREAIFVPFFGRIAATTPSLALFQRKTDAAVVPVFCRPQPEGGYVLGFEPAIYLSDLPPEGRTAEELTARYTGVTEQAVRRNPDLWLWMHNRWRTRPPDEAR